MTGLLPEPPSQIWLTPIARRVLDVQVALDSAPAGRELREPTFVAESANQLRRLKDRLLIYYVVTFVGAFIVASGGIPGDAQIEAFGVSLPLGLLSQQALAAIVAGLFSQYIIILLSFSLLHGGIAAQMSKDYGEGWEHRLARYDGSATYGSLLFPRLVGYRSPKRETAFIGLGLLTALISVLTHAAVVVGAAFIAFGAALNARPGFLTMTLSSFALLGTIIPLVLWLIASFLPMPYRISR